jgi:hypothetical protein
MTVGRDVIAHGVSQKDVVLNQQYVHTLSPLNACLPAASSMAMTASIRRQD